MHKNRMKSRFSPFQSTNVPRHRAILRRGVLHFAGAAAVSAAVQERIKIKQLATYTNITEVTAELLHTLVEKIVVHEKEVVDGQIIMRVDIYYRFIGKVGSMDGENLQTP